MDRVGIQFPSERLQTGLDTPSGSSRGQQRGSLHPSPAGRRPANHAYQPTPPYTPPGNFNARRGHQPSYNPPTLNPYRTSAQTAAQTVVPKPVRLGTQLYTLVREIQRPTNENGVMSDGVRVLKTLDGELVVEKRLRMSDKFSKERAGAEVRALEQIKSLGGSPHINTLVAALYTPGDSHSSLILDYCDQNSLKDVIESSRRRDDLISEQFCWHVLLQLSHAFSVCHYGVCDPSDPENRPKDWNTLCHLDVKPANVFLQSKKAPGFEHLPWPTVVLGDFGCTVTRRDIESGKFSKDLIPFGTDGWYPPEGCGIVEKPKVGVYGMHTDIWQLGGLILVMCHKHDYPSMNLVSSDTPCGAGYGTNLNKAVQDCMRNAKDRPSSITIARQVRRIMEAGNP